jgi:hypothetical protein
MRNSENSREIKKKAEARSQLSKATYKSRSDKVREKEE